MSRPPLPTQERLREMLSYEPSSGTFRWQKRRGGQFKVGDVAGSIDREGYLVITLDYRCSYAHQLAFIYMTGSTPGLVDHIDGNRANCRWVNLRAADAQLNARNRRVSASKKSCALMGVTRKGGRWQAQIKAGTKARYLGLYATPEAAHAAYLKAKAELH